MITAEQCRAGRALLNWSQDDLSAASKISKKTIAEFERGVRAFHERTAVAAEAALHNAGVNFIPENGGGPGVRLRLAKPRLFFRRDDVPGKNWVAFAFDYKAKRHVGFVTYDALAGIALDNLSPIDSFDRDRDRILTVAADKADANELDPEGRILLDRDDLPPVEWDDME